MNTTTQNELEFYVTLVVSTAHMTLMDNIILETINTHEPREGVNLFTNDEYGYRVFIPPEDDQHIDSLVEQLLQAGFSDAFGRLLQLASAHGCKILELDRDGPELSGFETFEW